MATLDITTPPASIYTTSVKSSTAAQEDADVEKADAPGEPVAPEREELEAAVAALGTGVQPHDLSFAIHEESGRVFVQVIDGATGEVIRQIPSEQALEAAEAIRAGTGGALFSKIV